MAALHVGIIELVLFALIGNACPKLHLIAVVVVGNLGCGLVAGAGLLWRIERHPSVSTIIGQESAHASLQRDN